MGGGGHREWQHGLRSFSASNPDYALLATQAVAREAAERGLIAPVKAPAASAEPDSGGKDASHGGLNGALNGVSHSALNGASHGALNNKSHGD